jgi:pimeloyl-ACP methyl ester carboxylesterase
MHTAVSIVTGQPGLLAAHIAGRLLERSGPVLYAAPRPAFESFEALLRPLTPKDGGRLEGRLRRVNARQIPAGAEVWHFLGTGEEIEASFLEALQAANVAALNVVSVPYCGGQRWRWLTQGSPPSNPVDRLRRGFHVTRSFRTSLTITVPPAEDLAQEGALHFLATLFDLKTEIEERGSDFFEHRALRCMVGPEAPVNLIRLEHAAKMILAIAERADEGEYLVASETSMLCEEFLERVGAAYDVSLLVDAGDGPRAGPQNRLDALFHLRLRNFASHLVEPERVLLEKSWRAADLEAGDGLTDADSLGELLERVHRQQQQSHEAMLARSAAIPDLQATRETGRDGQRFRYASIGAGDDTLVLLNALGQESIFLFRLMEQLRRRYRVLLWDPRGLDETDGSMTIPDHASDLAAILEEEGIDRCHLIAWCTGPKVAVEFGIRHPGRVRSMVFLNSTAKCAGSPSELDTPYERNFESLCRVLEQRPAMAQSVMNSLTASLGDEDADLLNDTDEQDASAAVLASMNRDLRKHVLRPFRNPESVIRYVKQLIDFWNYDLRETAGRIDVPVLLFSSEYDRVAAPQASEWIARSFPRSRLLHAQGATHYFLHDRADVMARMIEDFVGDHDEPRCYEGEAAAAQPVAAYE